MRRRCWRRCGKRKDEEEETIMDEKSGKLFIKFKEIENKLISDSLETISITILHVLGR